MTRIVVTAMIAIFFLAGAAVSFVVNDITAIHNWYYQEIHLKNKDNHHDKIYDRDHNKTHEHKDYDDDDHDHHHKTHDKKQIKGM